MKSKLIFALLSMVALLPVITGCSDDETVTQVESSVKSDIVERRWGITAATLETPYDIDGNGTLDTDVFAIRYKDTCREDDYKKFHMDGTLLVDDWGGWECNDGPKPTWTWSLTSDNTQLTIKSSKGYQEVWKIISTSPVEIKIRYVDAEMFDEPQTVVVTYSNL